MLSLSALNNCFDTAILLNKKYIGVRIAIGLTKEEVIINPFENFKEKRSYYRHAYNEELHHKFAGDQDIRITGFAYGDSYAEIEDKLTFYEVSNTSLN